MGTSVTVHSLGNASANSTDKGRRKKRLESALDQDDALEEGMATRSSILAWRIPWAEEPSGLQSIGCKELDTTKQRTHFSGVTSGNYYFYLLGCFSISKNRSKEDKKNPCGQSRGAADGSLLFPEQQTERHTVSPLGVALNRGSQYHSQRQRGDPAPSGLLSVEKIRVWTPLAGE